MKINKKEKYIFDSVLKTLIYNSIDDLKNKLLFVKDEISSEKYNLLIFGNAELYNEDCKLENKNMYRVIKELNNRWCLQSILYYHLKKTEKINEEEYKELLSI